jgi:hypothetical protein
MNAAFNLGQTSQPLEVTLKIDSRGFEIKAGRERIRFAEEREEIASLIGNLTIETAQGDLIYGTYIQPSSRSVPGLIMIRETLSQNYLRALLDSPKRKKSELNLELIKYLPEDSHPSALRQMQRDSTARVEEREEERRRLEKEDFYFRPNSKSLIDRMYKLPPEPKFRWELDAQGKFGERPEKLTETPIPSDRKSLHNYRFEKDPTDSSEILKTERILKKPIIDLTDLSAELRNLSDERTQMKLAQATARHMAARLGLDRAYQISQSVRAIFSADFSQLREGITCTYKVDQ